jgi:hypothetical protein
MSFWRRFRALIKLIISHVRLFMIISHVKIIAYQLSLFCKNYRFSMQDCPLYNKQKYTWMLGNTRSISRVEHDISLVCCAYTLEISCSTLEINLVLPRTHVLFSTIMIIIFKLLKCHSIYSIIVYDHFSGWWRSSRRTWITGT